MEVCGLQWSRDGSKLASGGNDNIACVWSTRDPSHPLQLLKGHEAAVKVCYILYMYYSGLTSDLYPGGGMVSMGTEYIGDWWRDQ